MKNSKRLTPSSRKKYQEGPLLLNTMRLGLPIVLIVAASVFFIARQEIATQLSALERRQVSLIEFAGKSIELELNTISQSLINLALHLEVRDYLSTWSAEHRQALQGEFYRFIKNNRQFDQARLLRMDGMEDIRINKVSQGAFLVPDDQLQNKSQRYYFLEARDLPPEAVYFSPLDLNIEHGVIEHPIKPMIRFAATAYDNKGKPQGVIVLNYLADSILHQLAHLDRKERSGIMLLNNTGYWLYSAAPEQCWGFMYPDRQGVTFSAAYPDEWASITPTSKGQMYSNGNLVTYMTINYLPQSNLGHNNTKALSWKLVGMIPRAELAMLTKETILFYCYLFAVLALLIFLAAFIQAKRTTEKRLSNREILQSRNRFRQIVEGSWDIIWEADPNGSLTYISPRIANILGYTVEEAAADPPFNLAPLLNQYGNKVENNEMSHVHWEEACMHKDGYPVWLYSTGTPFSDENSAIAGYRGITRDVTEQIHNAKELETARNVAERANKAKSEFLARMSHEIRTPMNAIIGMSHLALRTALTPRQKDYLQKIRLASDTLLRIINDILDFSKIEAGRVEIENHPFALNTILDNVINIVVLTAEEKGIELLLALDPEVPTGLYGDSLRLSQVLINLANNAVKFTEEGEVVITIQDLGHDENFATVGFSVKDTGIGLTEESIRNLYTPFYQADGSTTRLYGGTGLGLSISKRLVELMGGELTCKSVKGLGTEFSFQLTLPVAEVARQNYRMPESLKECRVLAVDDNPSALQVLSESLESFGLTVDTTISPKRAIEMMQNGSAPYDLVFMDWKMPEMDGISCIHAIRNLPLPELPKFIVVTAYGRDEIRQRLLSEGLHGLLLKPINRSMLFNSVMEAFDCGAGSAQEETCLSEQKLPDHIRGARILLAEDNELNQQVARELLQGAGMAVTIANNGEEAVNLVQQQEFQAVLMDIQMPLMDGLEAARTIRSLSRLQGLPIIAMTAHAMNTDRELSLQSGMNDHVNKPIDPDELYRTLGKWIHAGGWEPVEVTIPDTPPSQELSFNGSATLDIAAGMRRVRDNSHVYANLLRGFIREQTEVPDKIRQCLKHGTDETAFRLAHTLKGIAGNIGAMNVFHAAEKTCQALQDNTDAPERTLDALETAMGSASENIARYLEAAQVQPIPFGNTENDFIANKADQQAEPQNEMSSAEFMENLQKLREAIAIHDMAALALFESLSSTLTHIDAQTATELGDNLSSFAFKKAAVRLERLTTLVQQQSANAPRKEELP
ncbi:response regulator [Desulfovibrio mangrovi]|uniref:response regulator n=1 Tax=Desulfovibrio mangrovi TaxID=2976983 RepID=UPI0022452C78|nr:response regulator [Desulfovibrio mangrovi]UZP67773.1 response regulator [Desulfovibrio mangrovi]